eukprot:5227783-Ditylum_brightwellii.AAC.1
MLPKHVKQFLGKLHYQQIDVDYWISVLNRARSELSSILTTLYFINALQDFTKESVLSQLPLYCANFAAVLFTKTTTAPGVKSHLFSDYDVVSEV